MKTTFKNYCDCEAGATAIEYGLLAALIGLGIVAGASTLGNNLNDGYSSSGEAVGDAFVDLKDENGS